LSQVTYVEHSRTQGRLITLVPLPSSHWQMLHQFKEQRCSTNIVWEKTD